MGLEHAATKWEKEFEPRSTCLQVPFQEPNLNLQTSHLPFSSFLQEPALTQENSGSSQPQPHPGACSIQGLPPDSILAPRDPMA